MNPIDDVLPRLSNVRSSANGWIARCPGHEDEHASLSISTLDDGKVLLHCHAGCKTDNIVQAMGLKMKDLFSDNGNGKIYSSASSLGEPIRSYNYTDEARTLVYQVCRYNPKTFRQRRPDGSGGWIYNLRDISPLLYRLPHLLEAILDGKIIFIPEGERDVETLEGLGFTATCNSGGAGKFPESMVHHLLGVKVVILPDNDSTGKKHAVHVAKMLSGTASEIRILELPGIPAKGDVTDWVCRDGNKEQLAELVEATPLWKPEDGKSTKSEFPLTDLGDAERIAGMYGDEIRYNKEPSGRWYCFNGRTWEPDKSNRIYSFVDIVARQLLREASEYLDSDQRKTLTKHSNKLEGLQTQKNIVGKLQTLQHIQIFPSDLDNHSFLFNTLNYTLDLSCDSGLNIIHRQHCRKDLLTALAPVEYQPNMQCHKWLEFLKRIFNGDKELIQFVQQAVALSLTGDVSEQCFFFAYGTGANGKSVFFSTMKMLFGNDYHHKASTEMILQQRQTQPTHELAQLVDKRFCVFAEIPENRRLNESLVKDLTGGDIVSARNLYERSFIFVPTAKLWLYGNHEPVIGDSDSIWRRVRKIPFAVTIPEKEQVSAPLLLESFRAELPGILNWMLDGYLSYREMGLKVPNAVTVAGEMYREEMDTFNLFVEENCEVNAVLNEACKEIYTRYKEWCTDHGEYCLSMKKLNQKFRERGYTVRAGSGNITVVYGLRLLPRKS